MNRTKTIKKLRAVYDDDPSYFDPKYGKMIEDVMKEPWWKQNRRKKRVRHCYKPVRSFR